jgi:hypothetical protein
VTYWSGLIPTGHGQPLIAAPGKIDLHLLHPSREARIRELRQPIGVSWPAHGLEAVRMIPNADLALWFRPKRAPRGWEHLVPEVGGVAGLLVRLASPADEGTTAPRGRVAAGGDPASITCQPDISTRGELRWDAHGAAAGDTLSVELEVVDLRCSDGRFASLEGTLVAPILDVR